MLGIVVLLVVNIMVRLMMDFVMTSGEIYVVKVCVVSCCSVSVLMPVIGSIVMSIVVSIVVRIVMLFVMAI